MRFTPTGSSRVPRTPIRDDLPAELPRGFAEVASQERLASAEIFDPETRSFHPVEPMPHRRDDAAAVLLADGTVLVAGGTGGAPGVDPEEETPFAECARFDPATGLWRGAAPLALPRSDALLVRLPFGSVLAVMGRMPAHDRLGCELFDPAKNTWEAAAPSRAVRAYAAFAVWESGDVLLRRAVAQRPRDHRGRHTRSKRDRLRRGGPGHGTALAAAVRGLVDLLARGAPFS